MRRSGKQHRNAFLAVIFSADPLAGRGPDRIRKDHGSAQDVGLLGVVGRHLVTALGEALLQRCDGRPDHALQFSPSRVGDGLARFEVVFGRDRGRHMTMMMSDRRTGQLGRGAEVLRRSSPNNALEAHFETPSSFSVLGEGKASWCPGDGE